MNARTGRKLPSSNPACFADNPADVSRLPRVDDARCSLARDFCYLERFDEAEPLLRQSDAFRSNPVEGALARGVEALLLAARGEFDEAEVLARGGVAVAETDMDTIWLQGWSHEDLATVLERAGRIEEAREALGQALAVWERKRCLPIAHRLREQIDSLGRAQP